MAKLPQEDRDAIRRIVEESFLSELESDENWRGICPMRISEEAERESQKLLRDIEKHRLELARSDFDSQFCVADLGPIVIEHELWRFASFDNGAFVSDGIMVLVRELLKSQIEIARIKAARALGDYSSPNDPSGGSFIVRPPSSRSRETQAPKPPSKTLLELQNAYIADKSGVGSWNVETEGKFKKTLHTLLEVLGVDRPADSITYDDLRRVRDDYPPKPRKY